MLIHMLWGSPSEMVVEEALNFPKGFNFFAGERAFFSVEIGHPGQQLIAVAPGSGRFGVGGRQLRHPLVCGDELQDLPSSLQALFLFRFDFVFREKVGLL